MASKNTVHIIFHAHLDPLWLWNWQAGVDEALATVRSACDRLAAHPALKFSQGEAWVYRQVEMLDSALFARVREFVRQGRWEILGGWWTQPDCNFPDELGFRRQIEAGCRYFQEHFGEFPAIGFNPDSFGHSAALPGLMREYGQSRYVFMRPQPHEMTLPARIFRWRGYEDGPEVTVFRIHETYCPREITADFLRGCCRDLPEGVEETACFCGVGDHGGGPTEELIAQVERLQKELSEEMEIRFSTAREFFAALEGRGDRLPLVTGELQFHSIGCYSVHRESKTALVRATNRLRQMETMLEDSAAATEEVRDRLARHWQNVVFHQFHDTLGGTCIPSAYRLVVNQLGGAEAFAEEWMALELRRRLTALPSAGGQRLLFYNASEHPLDGWVEAEPWLGHLVWQPDWNVVDEQGNPVRFQRLRCEALVESFSTRLAVRLNAAPGSLRVLTLKTGDGPAPVFPDGKTEGLQGDARSLRNLCGAAISFAPGRMTVGNREFALPELVSYPDPSDTWSHGMSHYAETGEERPVWESPRLVEEGPFLREVLQEGRIGESRLLRIFRIASEHSRVEMRLRVEWQERNRILKLVLPYPGAGDTRTDGICAGSLERPQDGWERPVQRWTRLPLAGETPEELAIVCPDVFALDATTERVRLTLLRSCQLAHHDPAPGGRADVRFSDRGEHDFRFLFSVGEHTGNDLDQRAYALLRPVLYADLTR
ncbi:MAG: glycoside hydrolase family 38 C-terminal domain-containing protein [Oligosphaeraceae bacterium]